jgi:hypothetical protein
MMMVLVRMRVIVVVVVSLIVIVTMRLYGGGCAHCTPPSPFMSTFSNSESELRIAVVLSSRIFL